MEHGDVLAHVLERSGLHGRVFCQTRAHAPWGLQFEASESALFHTVLSGACWLLTDRARVQLVAGDVVLIARGAAHALADAPSSPKLPLSQWLATRRGEHGVLGLGGRGDRCEVLCGVYEYAGTAAAHPVLARLPARLHVRDRAELSTTLASLRAESQRGPLGSALIASRLLDVLLVQIVRAWVESSAPGAAGWIGALNDETLARALARIHAEPARAWSVEALARASQTSRATLTRRFVAQVGEPPLAYLTRVRLQEAASALARSDAGLAAIAADIGYATEFAFSRAFRRAFGEPPGKYRERMRANARGSSLPRL
jgi:AraC-like DNA-binding protein